jgi:hypothetical protein
MLDVVFESELIAVFETQEFDAWITMSLERHTVGPDRPGSRPNVRKDLISSAVKKGCTK